MCPLHVLLLCPLRVLLLWALLCPGTGNVPSDQEEIFIRPGSDLLLPIRIHLTLTHPDRGSCGWIYWHYQESPIERERGIGIHLGCKLSESGYFPNTRISENGSLIISNVTLDNAGIYGVDISKIVNRLGHYIQKDRYTVHVKVPLSDIAVNSSCLPDGSAMVECSVEGSDPRYSWSLDGRSVSSHSRVTLPPPVSGTLRCDVTNQMNELSRSINISCAAPVSDPALDVTCLQNGSTEISCGVEYGTDHTIYMTVSGGLEEYNVTSSKRTVRVTVPPVSPPDSWNIRCSAKNDISERSTNQMQDACPGWSGMWSEWGQYLLYGVVGVLCTALLIFILTNLKKRKNRSERRTREGCQTEMNMEPIYYNVMN